MRIRARTMRMHERRQTLFANVPRGFGHCAHAGIEVGAIHVDAQQAREAGEQLRDAAACRLSFDGNRDRVAVVFD